MWVPKGRTELLVQPTTPNNSYPFERQWKGILKTHLTTNTAINYHRLPAVLLVILFGLVVGIGLLFFAPVSKSIATSAWSQPSAAAAAPAPKAPASLEATTLPVRAELSNDMDHDGKVDGMADTLAVLAPLMVGGVCVLLRFIPLRIRPLVDNTYLLPLYKELKPGAVYYAPLERPG
jgi:hypothetical protein